MGSEQPRRDYVARVNRAIDQISRSLDQELSPERIAREACFSPFHFHRVFRAMASPAYHQTPDKHPEGKFVLVMPVRLVGQ